MASSVCPHMKCATFLSCKALIARRMSRDSRNRACASLPNFTASAKSPAANETSPRRSIAAACPMGSSKSLYKTAAVSASSRAVLTSPFRKRAAAMQPSTPAWQEGASALRACSRASSPNSKTESMSFRNKKHCTEDSKAMACPIASPSAPKYSKALSAALRASSCSPFSMSPFASQSMDSASPSLLCSSRHKSKADRALPNASSPWHLPQCAAAAASRAVASPH
mmetsp:Transcript_6133/g.17496  ORF Transcript_6133/g.17496 Transcript_6133/m.17496 type:complete len:225 (+) Transcript_6133:340-1014(+)